MRPRLHRPIHFSAPTIYELEKGSTQFLTQIPQPFSCRFVVGLTISTRLAFAVEVTARDPFQIWCGSETHGRLRALLDGAHRAAEGLSYHLRVHQGRRVQGVYTHSFVREALGQLEGEHDLGKLALRVGLHRIVVSLEHGILEVHGALAGGCYIDYPSRGRVEQAPYKQTREQEVREVVDGEGELVAVLAIGTLSGDYACVVDQHVQALFV